MHVVTVHGVGLCRFDEDALRGLPLVALCGVGVGAHLSLAMDGTAVCISCHMQVTREDKGRGLLRDTSDCERQVAS